MTHQYHASHASFMLKALERLINAIEAPLAARLKAFLEKAGGQTGHDDTKKFCRSDGTQWELRQKERGTGRCAC